MTDNMLGLQIEQPVAIWNREIKLNPKTLFFGLGKMLMSGAKLDVDGLTDNAIDLFKEANLQNNTAQVGWLLIYQALQRSLVNLITEYQNIFTQEIADADLESMAETISSQLNALPVVIDASFFERPQNLPLLEQLKQPLIHWLQSLGASELQATTIHARLKSSFVLALHQEWLANPIYATIKDEIHTPFTQANRQLQSWQQYYAWLEEQINQRMFDEVFGLKQVYVPLRAYYELKENCEPERERDADKPKPMVVDLMAHLTDWVRNFNKDDSIRVISGGPGSGKSSFSKMFAAHIAQLQIMPVLFIPLHHFKLSLDLISAINNFIEKDNFLKGVPFEKNLLLIFDGLDELSMQGRAANEAASAFIEELISELNYSNSQGCQRIALLTGRDLAVQSSQQRFRKTGQVLHVLPYFVEKERTTGNERIREDYQDPQQLLTQDQRDDWWRNYGLAKGKDYAAIPDALKSEELTPITREPLLNYLVALSFERGKLDFARQTTLNEIYADLLEAVYQRQWDSHRHTGTGELTKEQFFRILEEIALAIWHGDGRTATVAQIQKRCVLGNLGKYLELFQEGAEKGVTRLLTAFYFRQSEQLQGGDKTFEFTHKSFGEYLTARRIVRMVNIIDSELKRHNDEPDSGWNERKALEKWAEICGVTAIDEYLFNFLEKEVALQSLESVKVWQQNFIHLIESAVRHGMPMEKLGLATFQQMMQQSRNAEEALLAIHHACAQQTKVVLQTGLDGINYREWLHRLQGGKVYLTYLDFSNSYLQRFDLCISNLQNSNLSNSFLGLSILVNANLKEANLKIAYLRRANLEGADLEKADLEGADLEDAILTNANFENANLKNANLKNVRGLSPEQIADIQARFPTARF